MNFSSVTFAFVHCHVQCDIKLPDAKSRHPPGMTARTHGRSYRTSSVDTPTRFRTAHSQRDDIPRARARHTPRSRPRGASPRPSSTIIIIVVVVFVVVRPGSLSSLWGKSPTPPPPLPSSPARSRCHLCRRRRRGTRRGRGGTRTRPSSSSRRDRPAVVREGGVGGAGQSASRPEEGHAVLAV